MYGGLGLAGGQVRCAQARGVYPPAGTASVTEKEAASLDPAAAVSAARWRGSLVEVPGRTTIVKGSGVYPALNCSSGGWWIGGILKLGELYLSRGGPD